MHPNGDMWPVVIELKSARQLKRLVEQVVGYARCVNALSTEFEQLYSVILGRTISFSRPAEPWIVWPQAGEAQDPRESELASEGIRVVGYTTTTNGFRFRSGAPI